MIDSFTAVGGSRKRRDRRDGPALARLQQRLLKFMCHFWSDANGLLDPEGVGVVKGRGADMEGDGCVVL